MILDQRTEFIFFLPCIEVGNTISLFRILGTNSSVTFSKNYFVVEGMTVLQVIVPCLYYFYYEIIII